MIGQERGFSIFSPQIPLLESKPRFFQHCGIIINQTQINGSGGRGRGEASDRKFVHINVNKLCFPVIFRYFIKPFLFPNFYRFIFSKNKFMGGGG